MKHGPQPNRRPVVIVVCSVIRLSRRVRATCGPYVRSVASVVVRVVASDGERCSTLTAHVVLAAASSMVFSAGAAWAGLGGSELCKLASAMVVGALAVSAASLLLRRQLGAGAKELRPLLASTAQLVLPAHGGVAAAGVLRLAFDPPRSLAGVSAELTRAAFALPAQQGRAAVVRLVLRNVPALSVALEAHEAYRDMQHSARFVRHFALTAAALCPERPAAPYTERTAHGPELVEACPLPIELHPALPAAAELPALCA